jgi:peptide chain release factor 2
MLSGGVFDVSSKKTTIQSLDKEINQENFWNNPERARHVTQQRASLVRHVDTWESFKAELTDLADLAEMAGDDDQMSLELDQSLTLYIRKFDTYEFETMLADPADPSNAIVAIHPGAGGTESQDWAQMLLRLYTRWAERRGFKFKMLDFLAGDEAGIKSATFEITGEYAYGYLKSEVGVHRLVRISPFDSNSRRHTSFASVFVYPEIEEDVDVEINPNEIRIDVFRSSGPGGQGVNTTDSAVRLTHEPTGIIVTCQNERSQHRNRDIAMKILRARLYDIKLSEMNEEKQRIEENKKDIGWGSQIRSYVLHPYQMIKDHRTEMESGKVEECLDGDIDIFIEAYLRKGMG